MVAILLTLALPPDYVCMYVCMYGKQILKQMEVSTIPEVRGGGGGY